MPKAMVEQMNAAVAALLKDPAILDRLAKQGVEPSRCRPSVRQAAAERLRRMEASSRPRAPESTDSAKRRSKPFSGDSAVALRCHHEAGIRARKRAALWLRSPSHSPEEVAMNAATVYRYST
jgi:hypothetical protein